MTLTLTNALGARMNAAADRMGLSSGELAEWLLSDDLKRIEATQNKSPEISDALRAKIEATPLLVVDNAGRRTMYDLEKRTS